jgi:Ca-activated chloride channel homolog
VEAPFSRAPTMRLLRYFLLALLSWALTAPALANGLMAIDSSTATITPVSVEITTSVRDQVATTIMRQRFTNTADRPQRLRFLYPLSTSATVTGFRFWQHGELRVASMTGRPQDSTIYDTVPGGGLPDQRLLTYLGTTPFIFPFLDALAPDSSIVVELTTVELLRYAGGKVRMHIPFDMRQVGGAAVDLSMRFVLESRRDITSFEAVGLDMSKRLGTRSCTAEATVNGFAADHDIEIVYGLAQSALGVTLMSNKPDSSDGYFLMLAEPDPETSDEEIIGKCFTFVIDVSGSMMGIKLEQAKAAARYTIEHLNAGDVFNVIRFSSDCSRLFAEPEKATPSNVERAVAYIEALTAGGGTDIQQALLLALAQPIPESTANVVIFVTDGLAAVDQQKIIDANARGTRIYVFGIGADVNHDMLTTLAAGLELRR